MQISKIITRPVNFILISTTVKTSKLAILSAFCNKNNNDNNINNNSNNNNNNNIHNNV